MLLRLKLSALFVLAAAVMAACGEIEFGALDDQGPAATRSARVERVVDGDTLKLAGGERVRLIGVDTPETKKPGSPVECFGKAASKLTEDLVEGRAVDLAVDVEERDRYGRLLAYVTRRADGLDLNAELLRRGYATVLTVPPNVRREAEFRRLARQAREARRGLWRSCR